MPQITSSYEISGLDRNGSKLFLDIIRIKWTEMINDKLGYKLIRQYRHRYHNQ